MAECLTYAAAAGLGLYFLSSMNKMPGRLEVVKPYQKGDSTNIRRPKLTYEQSEGYHNRIKEIRKELDRSDLSPERRRALEKELAEKLFIITEYN